ncbi:hypothetical protein BFJ70_g16750 [Fusarium oxysporum]|nr:hypothetical protein BFJ70_g16750 [Fusarium oxysporum]
MELVTIVILCLLVYASWATIASNSLFHRTWSLALLLLPFFIWLLRQPPSTLTPLLITLLLLDLTFCVALSPVRLLFRSRNATERHNALDVLHDEPDAVADIVVVHGLASRPNETWRARPAKSPDAGDRMKENVAPPPAPLWLSDFLPKESLKCRILTFNHNTSWESNSLSKSLEDHGRDLLRALGRHREKQEEKERPIIFIGHSFGGIIIKQAVVIGQRFADDDYRGNIARRAQGFIFLGTPHDGSSLTLPGKLLTLINHWEGSSASLLEIIEPGSEANSRLHRDFLACYSVTIMVCFFEAVRETLWGIPLMHAVERKSAEIAGAEIIGSEKQHRDLQRFSSTNDNEYQDLVFSLRGLLRGASGAPSL